MMGKIGRCGKLYIDLDEVVVFLGMSGVTIAIWYAIARWDQWCEDRHREKTKGRG